MNKALLLLFKSAARVIGNPGYVPTTVVDKNGKRTTVYKLAGERHPSVKTERRDIETLIDHAKNRPLSAPDSVRVILGDQLQAIFEHGPAVMRDGQIVVRGKALYRQFGTTSGYGAVKIVWRHGEKSPKAGTRNQVTRADILRLPHLLRDIQPEVTHLAGGIEHRDWRIQRHDGAVVIYGLRQFHVGDVSHVITIHVLNDS